MKYKLWIILILFIAASGGIWWIVKSQNKCDHCNILMLDIDILRADELPCYGYFRNTTPNICEFAKKSIIFKDNYSTSFWTLPSFFSTITSLYPTFHRMRIGYNVNLLSDEIPTLAETLKKEGYRTVYVGSIASVTNEDNGGLRGYDVITQDPIEKVIDNLSKSSEPWFVHYYNSDLHLPYLLEENQDKKPIENLPVPKNLPITYLDFDRLMNVYLKNHYSEIFTKKAIAKYSSVIFGPDEPNDTSLTDIFNNIKGNNEVVGEYLYDGWRPLFNTYMESFDHNNPEDGAYVRMMYDTKLKILDTQLGYLTKKLESKPLSKNTITVITSDHGEAFGEHGEFSHNSNKYSELYYTPLIIRSPKFAGKLIEQSSSNADIFPTLMELTGLKLPDGLQGHSLVPYLNDKKNDSKTFIWSECSEGVILQNHDWLYFLPYEAEGLEKSELYNRIEDPAEKINVAKKYPDLVYSLYKQADLYRSYNIFNKIETSSSTIKNIDSQKLEQLRKEGYF